MFSVLPKATETDRRNRWFWFGMTMAAICFVILLFLHFLTGCAVLNQTYTATDGTVYKSRGMAFGQANIDKLKTAFSSDVVEGEHMTEINQSTESLKADSAKLMEILGPVAMQVLQWMATNAAKGAAIP